MATKKKDTPAGYDRWDTFGGTIKFNGTADKKAIDAALKEQRLAKQKKQKKKK